MPQTLQIPHDDFLQLRHVVPEVEPLVELLFVFHEEEFRFRVLNHILHLGPRIGGVNPDGHPACTLGSQIDDDPFRAIVPDDGHAVSLFKAHGDQGRTDVHDHPVVVVPGKVVPQAVLLFAHGHPVPMFSDRVSKDARRRFHGFTCHKIAKRCYLHLFFRFHRWYPLADSSDRMPM